LPLAVEAGEIAQGAASAQEFLKQDVVSISQFLAAEGIICRRIIFINAIVPLTPNR
jgi:hypothetical protein